VDRDTFYFPRLVAADGRRAEFGIGVFAQTHGPAAQLLHLPSHERLVIGMGCRIVGLDVSDVPVRAFDVRLGTPFQCLLDCPRQQLFIAKEDIGITGISYDGAVLWSVKRTLIERLSVAGDAVHVRFEDSPPVSIALPSGRVS
jgi:hypothetical protein